MTILRLVATDSLDGTQIILNKLFGSNLRQGPPPSKSALSQYRDTISYAFFQEAYETALNVVANRLPKWHGLAFVGVDGDVYSLPRSAELRQAGFRGQALDEETETHSLKMYTVTGTCLISGAPVAFKYSTKSSEIALALEVIADTRKNVVCVYDRLYLCTGLIDAHIKAGNYFVCRLRRGGTFREVADFLASDSDFAFVVLAGVNVRLVKTWLTEDGEPIAVATNIPSSLVSDAQLGEIYSRRWGSETANRDTTVNNALDAFHGRDLNKVLQEIYACLFLRLTTAAIIAAERDLSSDFLTRDYSRPSFKQVSRTIAEEIHNILSKGFRVVKDLILSIIGRSTEKRKRRSRGPKREVGYPRKKDFQRKTAARIT